MLDRCISFVLIAMSFVYPFVLWRGYGERFAWVFAFVLCCKAVSGFFMKKTWIVYCFSSLFFLGIALFNPQDIFKMLYPSFINLIMGILFALSMRGEAMITRFARIEHRAKKLPDLNLKEVEYTRFLTWIWVGVFLLNAIICAYLALLNFSLFWMLYSGIGSYVLVGIVILGERGLRKKLQKSYFKWKK